ncbi:MAG: haloacid dehalogenase type II [Terriglobales bacterium]
MQLSSSNTLTRRQALKIAGAALISAAATGNVATAQTHNGKFKAIGFDAFTIFDSRSMLAVYEENFPGKGKEIFKAWFVRLLEYTWLRTLNRTYVDLQRVSEDSLAFVFKSANMALQDDIREKLLNAFFQLKPFPDTVAALKTMRKAGIRLAYVSDLTPKMLKVNTENAGALELFEHFLSTDNVRAFKPDPRAYEMAETSFKLPREAIVFAATGGWDAAGAKSFGLSTFWVNHFNEPVEELGVKPDAIGSTLTDLAKYVTT